MNVSLIWRSIAAHFRVRENHSIPNKKWRPAFSKTWNLQSKVFTNRPQDNLTHTMLIIKLTAQHSVNIRQTVLYNVTAKICNIWSSRKTGQRLQQRENKINIILRSVQANHWKCRNYLQLVTKQYARQWPVTWTDTLKPINNNVAFSRCSMPPPDWYINLLGMSTSHRCCKNFTGCGLRTHQFQAGCARLPMPAWSGATVSFRLHPARCRLQLPLSSSQLVIQRTRLSTVGDRAFPVAGSRLWNSLPPDVTSAPTLTVFRNRLKPNFSPNHFLTNCFRFLVLYTMYSSGLVVLYLGHSK